MHTRNDSGVSIHSFIVHDNPPSPTLTNPDMIMPIPPWQHEPSFDDQGPHPLLEPEPEIPLSQTLSNSSVSTARNSAEELGLATTVSMHNRVTVLSPSAVNRSTSTAPTYTGYEHGAPLSDIYEESDIGTPKSSRYTIREEKSSSPTPARDSITPTGAPKVTLRHKKRISSLSTSSSGGSDVGDWENFDPSTVLTSRAAADLAQMQRADSLDVESSDIASRRQSREEEELAALNARAEKILENARKRLTNMDANLKVARNSIIMPQRSPNLGGEHQPVGGLYRSISAAGATKLGKDRQRMLPIRTSASFQHLRGNSETGVASTNKRFSRLEERSASALDYGSPTRYSLFPDTTPAKVQPSPVSTRSFNSPLRPLEEEKDSPSTAETTPESAKLPPMRGLGIHSSAAKSRENLTLVMDQQTPTPTHLVRSTSSGSTRSTKELKDQMTDLRSRIADLKTKAQAENMRRRSSQGLRSTSPFTNATPEQWYTGSPAYEEAGSPVNARAGVGFRDSVSPTAPLPDSKARQYDGQAGPGPITPSNARFLDVDRMTPDTEAKLLSSARTDRNTPTLARKRALGQDDMGNGEVDDDRSSIIHPSRSRHERDEDEDEEGDDDAEDNIAENEEEQIYLNEVLEESLREAEVEPEVPAIPGSFLDSPNGLPTHGPPEAERHEDRMDAFDYENMFLHSAMGTYTGKSINGSDSGSEDDSDDDGSVETSRAGARTPVDETDDQEEPEIEPSTDEEMENVIAEGKSPGFSIHGTPRTEFDQAQLRSPPRLELPQPPKQWAHSRSKSDESVSTSATFETATEGDYYDETPNEILNWDPTPSSSLGYSPTSYQAYRGRNSPAQVRHGFSSPQGGGRSTPQTLRTPTSPLRQQFGQHYEPLYDQQKASTSAGLGLGVIGGENAQYIADDGVPERFRKQPSPIHTRQDSAATLQQGRFRPESQATVIAASPAKSHARQQSTAASRLQAQSPLTPANHQRTTSAGSPVIVTVSNSPQRKVVINRSLQRPQSHILEPQISSPPDAPLPPPPSSAALQAQMASPKKVDIKRSRSGSSQKKSTPTMPSAQSPSAATQLNSPPTLRDTSTTNPPQSHAQIPNTEILMESLIKLADPSFSLAPGMRFDEIDKNLVLGLLGAVGGVCNSILRASVQSGTRTPEVGRQQRDEMVGRLRRRLEGAAHVLEGGEEERTSVSRTGLRIKEV